MYTYIIVDDESLIRKGTIKKLSPMSDLVQCIGEADEGQAGIRLIEAQKPDFVILDMQMPGMDGTQLLGYLSEHYPDMPLIVISGFRDFDYIKTAISADAIDYILKPFSREAIQECVQRAIQRLENTQTISRQIIDSNEQKEAAYYEYDRQYLTNLILGFHTGEASISSDKLKFINDTHQMILLTLHFSAQPADFHVQEWLEEGGFGDLALFLPSSVSPTVGFLILFLPNSSAVSTRNLVRQISDSLIQSVLQRDLSLLIGISQVHSDLKALHTAFEETSAALDQQELTDPSQQYYWYQGESNPRSVVWTQEDEFLFRIEAGMTGEVLNLTDSLFSWFTSISGFTLGDAKYFCYSLSNQCRRILNSYLKQENESSSNSMQNVVSQIFRLSELQEYYKQFFLNITDMLKTESVYALDDVIERVQIYIQRNYQKDLTQDFIASLFYLNRSYLSTLFRQKTGMKFVDYLNDVRIEKSKEMLSGTSRKMYQISKAVGYDNPKYFFRIFKKKTGMTPEQYRIEKENG